MLLALSFWQSPARRRRAGLERPGPRGRTRGAGRERIGTRATPKFKVLRVRPPCFRGAMGPLSPSDRTVARHRDRDWRRGSSLERRGIGEPSSARPTARAGRPEGTTGKATPNDAFDGARGALRVPVEIRDSWVTATTEGLRNRLCQAGCRSASQPWTPERPSLSCEGTPGRQIRSQRVKLAPHRGDSLRVHLESSPIDPPLTMKRRTSHRGGTELLGTTQARPAAQTPSRTRGIDSCSAQNEIAPALRREPGRFKVIGLGQEG